MNPGELAWAAGVYTGQSASATRKYNLRDAKSICLKGMPAADNDVQARLRLCAITPKTSLSRPNRTTTRING
jgi:hypothetical protein